MRFDTPPQITAYAKKVYAGNVLLRCLLYTRWATLNNLGNPLINPASIVINVQGHAGVGKTAMVRELARQEQIAYKHVDVGAVTDIAEIFGLARIDEHLSRTVATPPSWWPDLANPLEQEGIINIDDLTRAMPHVIQGLQQFIINRKYHNLELPPGWTIVVTSNPDNGMYNVVSTDLAFATRIVTVAYNRPEEIFIEQLERQAVCDTMANFWIQNKEQLNLEQLRLVPPEPNDRVRMTFNHLFPYLEQDEEALVTVGSAMFGYTWVEAFLGFLRNDEPPISPEEILDSYGNTLEERVQAMLQTGRNDLLRVSCHRLVNKLRNLQVITPRQWEQIASFLVSVPNDVGAQTYISLVKQGNPKADLFAGELNGSENIRDHFSHLFRQLEEAGRR